MVSSTHHALDLIGLCLAPLTEERRGWLEAGAEKVSDWEELERLACDRHVAPLVFGRLRASNLLPLVPAAIRERLDWLYLQTAAGNALRLHQMLKVASRLGEEGVRVLFVKGTSLVLAGDYADPAQRMFADVDVMVEEQHREAVRRAFARSDDWQELPPNSPEDWKETRWFNAWRSLVEVHWHLDAYNGVPEETSEQRYWRGAEPLVYRGTQVWVPKAEDRYLFAAIHGTARHGFDSAILLIAVADLAHLAGGRGRKLDWGYLARVAAEERMLAHVAVATEMAWQLCGLESLREGLLALRAQRPGLSAVTAPLVQSVLKMVHKPWLFSSQSETRFWTSRGLRRRVQLLAYAAFDTLFPYVRENIRLPEELVTVPVVRMGMTHRRDWWDWDFLAYLMQLRRFYRRIGYAGVEETRRDEKLEAGTDGKAKPESAAALAPVSAGGSGEKTVRARSEYRPPRVKKGTVLDSRAMLTRIWDTPTERATAPALRVGTFKHIQAQGWMAVDAVLGAAAMVAGLMLTPYYGKWTVNYYFSSSDKLLAILIFSLSLVFSGLSTGLYDKATSFHRMRIVTASLATCLLAIALTALFFAMFLFLPIGRWVLTIALALSFAALTLLRLSFYNSLLAHKIKVLIVGESAEAFSIYQALKAEAAHPHYQICALCPTDPGGEVPANWPTLTTDQFLAQRPGPELGLPLDPELFFCSLAQVKACCEQLEIEKIIVGDSFSKSLASFSRLMNCFPAGLRIMSWGSFNEEFLQHVAVDNLSPEWFYSANVNVNNPFLFTVKRGFDLGIAGLGLFLTLPLMLLATILIKLTRSGPVFYTQTRTGRFGRPFRLYKFRTLAPGAEEQGDAPGTAKGDARGTPVGRFLRRSRLDELPQLWNILRGEMSLIGPRPERPEQVEHLARLIPFYDLRHLVSPGLTGFAQINHPDGASLDDAKNKLQYDLYYIKYLSLFFDFQILLRTISLMLRGAL